jgi:NADP-dependent 3-hydroxy acid dehydrogenase YdfG
MEKRTAIITGASSGIGEATAKLLAKHNINVVLVARRTQRLEKLKAEIEGTSSNVLVVSADVTDREIMLKMAETAVKHFGKIDILINNAGIMPLSLMKNLQVKEWDKMIDVNIKGVLNGVAAVLPNMISNNAGHIINISSLAGKTLFPGSAVYSGTKFAVGAISEGLRLELNNNNIQVTVIEPGAVTTELQSHISDPEIIEIFKSRFESMPDILKAEDIAESIFYAINQPKHVNIREILITPFHGL